MESNTWAGKRDDNTLPEDQIAQEIKVYNEAVAKVTQGLQTLNDLYATIPKAETLRQVALEFLEAAEDLEGLETTLPHVGCGPHV